MKNTNLGVSILRIVTGVIFFLHGFQKLTEMNGITGVGGFFAGLGIPLPEVSAAIVIFLELVGGILLIVGLGTRWVAIPLAVTMLVALVTVHLPNGFFAGNGGYELVLALAASCVALFFTGSGAYALDNVSSFRRFSRTPLMR